MSEYVNVPVELMKGHDNSANGFPKLAYVKLQAWLAKKLCYLKKDEAQHTWFQVTEETEKAYRILFCKDTSMSYEFVRPTWFLGWVAKSVVLEVSKDFEKCEKEEQEYYFKKYKIKEDK